MRPRDEREQKLNYGGSAWQRERELVTIEQQADGRTAENTHADHAMVAHLRVWWFVLVTVLAFRQILCGGIGGR